MAPGIAELPGAPFVLIRLVRTCPRRSARSAMWRWMMTQQHPTGSRVGRHDAGQAVGLILISVALVAACAMGMIAAARHVSDRSRAQSAADAAALAGVDGGRAVSMQAARRNDATLISFERGGDSTGFTVTVEVAVGDEHALARASSVP